MSRYLPTGLPPSREPNLRRPPPCDLGFGKGAALGRQQCECRTDPVGRFVPPKQVADRCSGDPRGTGMEQRTLDLVGYRVAQGVAENMRGRRLAKFPDGKSCPQVRLVDIGSPVEQSIDQGQTDRLGLSPSCNGTQQSCLGCRQPAGDGGP